MISLEQIKFSMRMLEEPSLYLSCDAIHKQIAKSLEVYEDRQEYDGTLESAIECLKMAQYEVEEVLNDEA